MGTAGKLDLPVIDETGAAIAQATVAPLAALPDSANPRLPPRPPKDGTRCGTASHPPTCSAPRQFASS